MVTGAEGTDQNRSMGRFALDGVARAGPGNRSAVYRNDAGIALFETAAGRWTVGPLGAQVDNADMIQARHTSTCPTDGAEPCGYSCPTDPAKWAVDRAVGGPPDGDPVTLTVSCMAGPSLAPPRPSPSTCEDNPSRNAGPQQKSRRASMVDAWD